MYYSAGRTVAAEKLAESLDELYKTFQALDDEMVRYLALSFEPGEPLAPGRAVLLGLEVGQSKIRMHEARGHCAKIKNIYHKHLNGWFDRVLGTNNRQEVQKIFSDIGTTDDRIVKAVDSVAKWLTEEAGLILDLIDRGDRAGADIRVKQARMEAKPTRVKLTDAMSQLRAMQADFIAASKTV